jgi:hypothetical protein
VFGSSVVLPGPQVVATRRDGQIRLIIAAAGIVSPSTDAFSTPSGSVSRPTADADDAAQPLHPRRLRHCVRARPGRCARSANSAPPPADAGSRLREALRNSGTHDLPGAGQAGDSSSAKSITRQSSAAAPQLEPLYGFSPGNHPLSGGLDGSVGRGASACASQSLASADAFSIEAF